MREYPKCANCETTEDTRTLCSECWEAYQSDGLDGLRWRRHPNEDGLPEELISVEQARAEGIDVSWAQTGSIHAKKV